MGTISVTSFKQQPYFINASKHTGTALPPLKLFINPCFATLNTRSLWANLLAGSYPESSRLSTLSRELWQMLQLWVTILISDSWKDINGYKWSVVKKAELIQGR